MGNEPQIEGVKVRFVAASTRPGDDQVGDLKPVLAYPHAGWSWQQAYIGRDVMAHLSMQTDVVADVVNRHDLGEATVELVNIRPVGVE